jgi:hypothetical protein
LAIWFTIKTKHLIGIIHRNFIGMLNMQYDGKQLIYCELLYILLFVIWQGMVVVENATLLPISSHEELEAIVHKGLERRHTSGTQMNAESSRSHLILSVIVESTNRQSQVLVKGKVRCCS